MGFRRRTQRNDIALPLPKFPANPEFVPPAHQWWVLQLFIPTHRLLPHKVQSRYNACAATNGGLTLYYRASSSTHFPLWPEQFYEQLRFYAVRSHVCEPTRLSRAHFKWHSILYDVQSRSNRTISRNRPNIRMGRTLSIGQRIGSCELPLLFQHKLQQPGS